MDAHSVEIRRSVFASNYATRNGGDIAIHSSSQVLLSSISFLNNSASFGGSIHIFNSSNIAVVNVVASDCTSSYGKYTILICMS